MAYLNINKSIKEITINPIIIEPISLWYYSNSVLKPYNTLAKLFMGKSSFKCFNPKKYQETLEDEGYYVVNHLRNNDSTYLYDRPEDIIDFLLALGYIE